MRIPLVHEPCYADVEHLRKQGTWPNGQVPAWADELSQKLQCFPVHSAVLEYAAAYEIQKLRDTLMLCRAAMLRCDQLICGVEVELATKVLRLSDSKEKP